MSKKYILELDEIEFNWLHRLTHQQYEIYKRNFDYDSDNSHMVFIDSLVNKFRSLINEKK